MENISETIAKGDFFRTIANFFKTTHIKFRKMHEIFILIDSTVHII